MPLVVVAQLFLVAVDNSNLEESKDDDDDYGRWVVPRVSVKTERLGSD